MQLNNPWLGSACTVADSGSGFSRKLARAANTLVERPGIALAACAFTPVCSPPHVHPLLLPWQAPLSILSLAQTDPRRAHLHICPQALHQGSRFRLFLPLCFPPLCLPLQWRALWHLILLAQIHTQRAHLHICPQALHRGSRLRLFPPLRLGTCLRHFLPPFRGSHMQGHPPKQCSGLI